MLMQVTGKNSYRKWKKTSLQDCRFFLSLQRFDIVALPLNQIMVKHQICPGNALKIFCKNKLFSFSTDAASLILQIRQVIVIDRKREERMWHLLPLWLIISVHRQNPNVISHFLWVHLKTKSYLQGLQFQLWTHFLIHFDQTVITINEHSSLI